MSKDLRLPTYEQFLEYRATVIRAIALAWHSPAF
ncbi:BMA_0021/BMA_0022 family TOMM bacteriocin, partial [Burkholderia cepacia]